MSDHMTTTPIAALGTVVLRTEYESDDGATQYAEGWERLHVVEAPRFAAISLEVLCGAELNKRGMGVTVVGGDSVVICAVDGDYVYKVSGWSRVDRALICRLEDRP